MPKLPRRPTKAIWSASWLGPFQKLSDLWTFGFEPRIVELQAQGARAASINS